MPSKLQIPDVDSLPGLNGTLPRSLINAEGLTVLSLGDNSLSGRLPPLPAGLQTLEAADNMLSGAIPQSLASPAMRVLDLSGNNFNGEFLEGEEGFRAFCFRGVVFRAQGVSPCLMLHAAMRWGKGMVMGVRKVCVWLHASLVGPWCMWLTPVHGVGVVWTKLDRARTPMWCIYVQVNVL